MNENEFSISCSEPVPEIQGVDGDEDGCESSAYWLASVNGPVTRTLLSYFVGAADAAKTKQYQPSTEITHYASGRSLEYFRNGRLEWVIQPEREQGESFTPDRRHALHISQERAIDAMELFVRGELDAAVAAFEQHEGFAHDCHVCGLDVGYPPWGQDGCRPFYDICPCCGCEYANEDRFLPGFVACHQQWIRRNYCWEFPHKRPADWSLDNQLKNLPTDLWELRFGTYEYETGGN